MLDSAISGEQATFGGNRAVGRVAFSTEVLDGKTRRAKVFEEGSLRVRFPKSEGDVLEAVLVNTAGGMTGGDQFAMALAVGQNSRVSVGTVAAEKVYRSLGDDTTVDVKLNVGSGASLSWLPQETILFDQSRFSRSIDVNLEPDASILLAEATVFGRTAMGEQVVSGAVFDRWRIRRDGRLIFAETFRLNGAISARLSEPALTAGAAGIATIVIVPGDMARVEAVRALMGQYRGQVGASAWNGLAVVRCCASDGAALRYDLAMILSAVSDSPLPRIWKD